MLLILATALAFPLAAWAQQMAITQDQLTDLVKFGMDSGELVKKIKDLGIDFEPTDDYVQALRNVGAADAVIQALRQVRPKPLTRTKWGSSWQAVCRISGRRRW